MRIIGVNPYVLVGARQAASLRRNWRGPMPVLFSFDRGTGRAWRTNMMPTGGGDYRLYLNGLVRREHGVSVGDSLTLEASFDDEYRGGPQHPMPPWFREGLKRDQRAMKGWSALPPSAQKEVLRYFARLKSAEARQRNLARALGVLAGKRDRFLGRVWNPGPGAEA